MYTTTLAAVREKARAQIRPAKLSLPNLRFPGPPFFWRNLRGGGGGVVVIGGRLFKIVKFMYPDAGIPKNVQEYLENTFPNFPSHEQEILSGNFPKGIGEQKGVP